MLIRGLKLHFQCKVLRRRNGCIGAGNWGEQYLPFLKSKRKLVTPWSEAKRLARPPLRYH